MPKTAGYSRLQIALHWAVALGVGFNYIFSDGMGHALDAMLEGQPTAEGAASFGMVGLHIWVGMAVLVLVALRIALRVVLKAPEADAGMAGLIAVWGHRALYLGLLLVPVLGSMTWFGRAEAAGDLHVFAANALMVLAGGHALMAIFHHYVLKDGLMYRMTRAR